MAKILLADDEQHIEMLVRFKLSKEGHSMDYAKDGEEALAMIEAETSDYDAVILDIMMPVFDGIYVLKKIRENLRFKDLPVILLTAKSQEKDVIIGYNAGATEYITKPFSPSEFYARIKRHLK